MYETKVKWCAHCNHGWLEIVKLTATNELFIQCSECLFEWKDPEHLGGNEGDYIRRDILGSVAFPTIGEIEKAGWTKYLIDG